MEVIDEHCGMISNFEVLQILKERVPIKPLQKGKYKGKVASEFIRDETIR
jgi:hypothetical protein